MGKTSFLKYADCIIECCQEKIRYNGEDSYYTSINDNASIVSVFDGCGGSGAKKYNKFQNKTGAYMSSRVVAGATKDWFAESFGTPEYEKAPALSLKKKVKEYLSICKEVGDEASALKGGLTKDFPTTASIIIASSEDNKNVDVLCLSVGDSRCYLLSPDGGLMQLSEDDLGNIDAMENLTTDAALTNVITTSKDFDIHQKKITVKSPCVLFTATDGCFGYLSTPMEFEYLLIDTLLESQNVLEWEGRLKDIFINVSGDDFSFTGLSIGFGTFQNLQNSFRPRVSYLHSSFISKLKDASLEEKKRLWGLYKGRYELYIRKPVKQVEGEASDASSFEHIKKPQLKVPILDEEDSLLVCPKCNNRTPKAKFCQHCGCELNQRDGHLASDQSTANMYRPDDLD